MEFDIFLTLSNHKAKVRVKAFELPYHPNVFAREDECQKHFTVTISLWLYGTKMPFEVKN